MNELATRRKNIAFGFKPTASSCLQSSITLTFVKKKSMSVEKKTMSECLQ